MVRHVINHEGGGLWVLLRNVTAPKLVTLCKPKVYYHVHKNPLLVRVLCQTNPLQDFSRHIFKIYFNIILPSKSRCSNWSVDITFSNQTLYAFLKSYSLYRRLGVSQGRSGRVQKISPPPGFDTRTDQPVKVKQSPYRPGRAQSVPGS